MKSPLLYTDSLPPFDQFNVSDIEPTIDYLLATNRAEIKNILEINTPNWENTIIALEELTDKLDRVWSMIQHLHAVAENDALRKVYYRCLPKIADYNSELGQNKKLFKAYQRISESPKFKHLSSSQKKVISNEIRDFSLAGIGLPPEKQKLYRGLQKKLAQLSTQFEENLLDSTDSWHELVTETDKLRGLTDNALAQASKAAEENGQKGWRLTLKFPSYIAVMQYAEDATLRRKMYHAYHTRASETGLHDYKWDNSEIIRQILALRSQKAKLLGYESYAHYSLETKMAKTPDEVLNFLYNLVERSKPRAQEELQELAEFAGKKPFELATWDILYYSEKLRQTKFSFSEEQLRPYFQLETVLGGLFELVHRLYKINVIERIDVPHWHQDVKFFDIKDQHGNLRGSFYLDSYARRGKREGAWMDECITRRKGRQGIQHPVAYLNCNFNPPLDHQPSLLSHDEVITLFHEFGHGLHHMLTKIEYAAISGINGVPWDAVELPSQFMENWCWQHDVLNSFARHYQTGEKINPLLLEKLSVSKNFQAALQTLRQAEFALFDFKLHLEFAHNPELSIQELLDEIRRQVAVIIPPDFNRFQHSFSHIFAGGYAAGYYSYKWAELLSVDVFAKFEEEGLLNAPCGTTFLETILEQGGSRDLMELFIQFRGRKPSIDPLLKNYEIC